MRVGFIGAGIMSEKMALTISKLEGIYCYAVAAREKERAKVFSEKYDFQVFYGSYEELVEDENVDLVYIATPHSHHYEHAKLALENNKHVLCEKAFMVNYKQANEIIQLARYKKLVVADAIWTRYMPSKKIILDILESEVLGEISSVSANLGYNIQDSNRISNPELAGGALLDVGIYPINFVCMFLGTEIQEIISTCNKSDKGVDLQNTIIFKYQNGIVANIHSTVKCATEQYGTIYGTKGFLLVKNINNIDYIGIYDLERKLLKEYKIPEQISGYEYELLSIKNAIEMKQVECVEMPHSEILTIMRILDEIRDSWNMKFPFEDNK